jgi:heat shock protein HslJ
MTSHRARRLLLHSILAGSLFATAGCETASDAPPPIPFAVIVGDWRLAQFGEEDAASLPAEPERRPTLVVDEAGKVNGFAGVNRYGGSLSAEALAEGAFFLGPIVSTRMAGPREAMDLETRFLRTLGEASTFRVDGEVLVLEAGGESLLRFTRTGGD